MNKTAVKTTESNLIQREFIGKIGKLYTTISISLMFLVIILITFFVASKGLSTFIINKVNISNYFFGVNWQPDEEIYGILPFIFGSFAVAFLAVLLSTPLSIGAAIFMSEIAPKWGNKVLQPIIELLVGIPSVVYGYIGLTLIVPFIRVHFGGMGFSLAAGMLVLSIMILPTITSVAYDTVKVIPDTLKEASYALGATRWQTIAKVIIPVALPNILTGVVLGMARAFGEALAVQMVIGNVTRFPKSIFDSASTLTSILTLEMGNTVPGSTYNNALWSMALILLIMSFIFIALIRFIGKGAIANER